MKKSYIAFDLDGCLIHLVPSIDKHIFEIYGIDIANIDRTSFSYEASGLSNKELWKIFRMVYKEIETTPIFPGATELLTKLYEKTNEPPMILTARPSDAANDTYCIVKRLMKKIPFTLILKHPNAYKSQYLKGYKIYVEDRRRTALELAKLDFIVPLVKTDYNLISCIEDYSNIFYIDGVYELIPYIDDLISSYIQYSFSSFDEMEIVRKLKKEVNA